ncbi:MAG TPA: M23 family metallopeptidase [Spirochaetota bacterium]|nr:M23 family metallopeptidase [Spirochaetota bacterium]
MNQTNNFKKFEKKVLIGILNFFALIKRGFLSFVRFFLRVGTQKVTVMFIPHSEKKVFNFRVNVFLLFLFFFLSLGVLGAAGYLTFDNYNKSYKFREANLKTQINEKKSREYEDMLSEIQSVHRLFKGKLNVLLSKINSPTIKVMQDAELYGKNQGGPLNRVETGDLSEFDIEKMDYNKLLVDYQYANLALSELNKKTEDYNKILKDLPFGSPVKGFYTVTCGFGLRIHPITKVLDNHTGIDLAYQPGTPIVSTAPGVVEKVEWNPGGYGWYLKIYHKLGFSTLYAHLRSQPIVSPGEKVKKGQIIGYMGSTGASTGTHVHYEVRLGNSLKDPWDFLNIY